MTNILLDNYKLLDCYLDTNYLTNYLDNITSYSIANQELILPRQVRSKSLLSNKGYRLLISNPRNTAIHLASLYILFYLDKAKPFRCKDIQTMLQLDFSKYKAIHRTVRIHRLKAILRPSKPYIGLKRKRGYTGSGSGL